MKLISPLAIAVALFPLSLTAQDYDAGVQAAKSGNYAEAMTQWLPLAEGGNVQAQLGLATIYLKGLGVEKDYANAAQWYSKAAQLGDESAQYALGMMFANGMGIAKNDAQALALLQMAAKQGHAKA